METGNNSLALIVLGATKFSDNGVILHCLTRPYGRRSFLLRVGKKTRQGAMMPLSLAEADITRNPKSDLWSARNLSERVQLNGIRGSLVKNTMTLFMAEVLLRSLREGLAEEGLFEWAENSILTLDSLQGNYPNYPIRFLLEFSAALGFRPKTEDIAPFAEKELPLLRQILQADFESCLMLPLCGEERNALLECLIRYLEYHLEAPLPIKSLPVLRAIFSGSTSS